MILIRDIFQLKFGMARDAIALWKQMPSVDTSLKAKSMRLLTDLVGAPYYTLVMEMEYESLGVYEEDMKTMMSLPQWREWYVQFLPLCEGGRREIFTIVQM